MCVLYRAYFKPDLNPTNLLGHLLKLKTCVYLMVVMKKIILAFLVVAVAVLAYARTDVDLSLGVNVPAAPYYVSAPSYYVADDEPYWMEAPVQIVYFEGAPHRMHWWHNHWYDESWSHGGPRGHGHERYQHESWEHRGWH